jgi:hypothetical protein
MILYMLVAGLVAVELPKDHVFDYVIDTLDKINAKVKNADRTTYLIEGKSATAMTGFSFAFQIRVKPYPETNSVIEVLAPLNKQFINSFMNEFTKIVTPIREPVIIELASVKELEHQIEQNEQNEITSRSKEAAAGE